MNLRDKKQFSELMIATASVYSKDISPQMLSMFWGILQDFDFEDVRAAFSAHLRKSKFFPTPAEILFYMPGAKSHVGADEAWAIALKSMDEEETVVWTQQILEARAIAWDVFVRGDEIAARMAFKDAYNRLVASAPPPVWNVSLGFDAEQRITAINRAVDMGRLPQSKRLEIEQHPSVQRLIGQTEERVRQRYHGVFG